MCEVFNNLFPNFGKLSNRLILILIIVGAPLIGFAQSEKKMLLKLGVEFKECKDTRRISLIHLIPQDIEGKQKIQDIHFNIEPVRIFEENGSKYAEFEVGPSGKPERNIFITIIMNIYQSDLKTIKKMGNALKSDSTELAQWLIAEKYIEKDDPYVIEIASRLEKKNREATVKSIYSYVIKNVKYGGYYPEILGAKYALENKIGDCTEFASVFVVLCRALGIPARSVHGYVSPWSNIAKHDWAEYYHEELGWIPIDPTVRNIKKFDSLDNKYVYLSHIHQDKNLGNGFSLHYRYYGEAPVMKQSIVIKEIR